MSLGLAQYHTGGGDFVPGYRYDARSGRITRVDRTADGTAPIKIDVTDLKPAFAFDIGSIEIGWLSFHPGVSVLVVPYGQPMPARPNRDHKAGFRSKVFHPETGMREFSARAGVTVNAIEGLWDQWAAAPEAAAGKVPVIQFMGAVPITGKGTNTNYAPVFNLLQWIERDERVFGPRTVGAPGQPAIAPVPAVANSNQPAPVVASAWPAQAPVAAQPAAWPVAA